MLSQEKNKTELKIRVEPAFTLGADLEQPKQALQQQPSSEIGATKLQKPKKKKRKLQIAIDITAEKPENTNKMPDLNSPTVSKTPIKSKPNLKIEIEEPNDLTEAQTAEKNNITDTIVIQEQKARPVKKKKRLNITVKSPSQEGKELIVKPLPQIAAVDNSKKPPTLTRTHPATNIDQSSSPFALVPKQPSFNKQETFMDNLLNALESEINPRRRTKLSPLADKSTINNQKNRAMLPNADDLDQEYEKANLRRNNSDSIRTKDELKTKKIILRELQDLKDLMFHPNNQEKSEIDIAFLHASPIFIEGPQGKTSLVALKFQEEKTAIIEAINSCNQSEDKAHVRFRQSVATKDKFIDIIRKRPTCLHISCHGLDQADTSMRLMQEADQRNLLFETENGDGRLISQRELNKILKQAMTKIKLVFVAACMSDFVGKIFQQCDVPHVICSEQGKTILDDAAISFSKSFYSKLFSGEAVCKAFKEARNEVGVKFNENEANRFQLMISTKTGKKHSAKNCKTYWPQKEGKLECLSEHIKFKHVRTNITNFVPREIDFFKLVCFIQAEPKLAHYRGLPGIGKTYMVRKVLTYLCERKYFSAGVLYLPLNDDRSVQQFLITLRNQAMSFFKINHDERFELCMKLNSDNSILDFLVEFFEDKALPQFQLVKQKNFSSSKNRRFLMVLDNCEGLIDSDGEGFRSLLSFFQDKCKMLKIVVVSRNELGSSNEGEELQPLILPQLGSKQAVQFFLSVLEREKRNISIDEVVQLILECPTYPIKKVFHEVADKMIDAAELVKIIESSLNVLESNNKLVEILSHHDLFRLLQGNPTSISRAANVYMNQSSDNDINTLQALYKKIKQNDVYEASGSQSQASDKTRPKRRLNNESLQATTKLAIDMLPSTESKDLLYFIGCMPAGVTMLQLNKMWGSVKVDQDLPGLLKLNLVEKILINNNSARFELNPVLYQFIDQDIETEDKKQFMNKIIQFYTMLLFKIYQQVAIVSEDEKELQEHGDGEMSPVRHHESFDTFDSLGGSSDFRNQLSELKSGLKQKQAFKGYMLGSCGSGNWQWQASGIESSITQQIIQELPNLNRCMDHLLYTNGLQSASFNSGGDNSFNETVQFNNSFRASNETNRQSHVLINTINKKTPSVNSKRMGFRSRKSITEDYSPTPNLEPSMSISSAQSKAKDTSPNLRKQSINGLQRDSDRRPRLPSNLHVIDERTEQTLNATSKSQQSEESPDKQQQKVISFLQKQQPPDLHKKNSSPFSTISGPYDSDSHVKNQLSSGQQGKSPVETKLVRQVSQIGLNLNKTMARCDQFFEALQARESSSQVVMAGRLDARARDAHKILEPDSESDGDDQFQRSDAIVQVQNLSYGKEQSQSLQKNLAPPPLRLGDIGRLSLEEKKVDKNGSGGTSGTMQIHVSHLNLNSDRKFTGPDLSDGGWGDVREGSDLSSYDSESNKGNSAKPKSVSSGICSQASLNQPIGIQKCSESSIHETVEYKNQFSLEDRVLNSGRTNNGHESNSLQSPLLVGQESLFVHFSRRKSAHNVKKAITNDFDQSDSMQKLGSSTMKFNTPSMIDQMGKALSKQVQLLKDLNTSAVFTIRKTSHVSKSSPKNSRPSLTKQRLSTLELSNQTAKGSLPDAKMTSQGPSPDQSQNNASPSPISTKSPAKSSRSNRDKMSLLGEFIIYTTVNALLVDNVNFAYQISQTDFSNIEHSVLFLGNLTRLKSLAAEQIFLRYFDANEPDSYNVVQYLMEAVRAGHEAKKCYSGEQDKTERNEYGLALSSFHLGYLYEKYADKMCERYAVEGNEDICGDMIEEDFRRKARENFREAFSSFELRSHLKGMYMAKQQEADLYEEADDETIHQNALKQAQRCKNDYERHVAHYGYSHCCHIPRLHGYTVSLLTEIVRDNEKTALFRIPTHVIRQRQEQKESQNFALRRIRTETEKQSMKFDPDFD